MKETMPRLRCRTQTDHLKERNWMADSEVKAEEILKHPVILQSFEIDSFNLSRFGLRKLDPSFAVTPSIAQHPSYLAILELIAKFNQDTAHLVDQEHRSFHSKKEIMDVTMNMLRIMMLSSSASTKTNVLDLTLHWLQKQLHLKEANSSSMKLKERGGNVGRNQGRGEKLQSEAVKEEKDEFQKKFRTAYKDRHCAKEQLKEYVTHKIELLDDLPAPSKKEDKLKRVVFQPGSIAGSLPADRGEDKPQGELSKVEIREQISTLETNPCLQTISHPSLLPPQSIPLPQLLQEETQQQLEDKSQSALPENRLKAFLDPEPYEQSNPQADQSYPSQGQLDPKIKAYTSALNAPSVRTEKEAQSCLATKTLEHESQSLKKLLVRQDSDITKRMQMWAASRAKFKSELSRKIESSRMFFQDNQKQRKHRWNKLKINEAVKGGKQYLRGELRKEDSQQREAGLSAYCTGRRKVASTRSAKTLEVILRENSRSREFENGLAEVEELKDKLSKKRVYASLSMLKNSMVTAREQQLPGPIVPIERPLDLLSNPLLRKKRKRKVVVRH